MKTMSTWSLISYLRQQINWYLLSCFLGLFSKFTQNLSKFTLYDSQNIHFKIFFDLEYFFNCFWLLSIGFHLILCLEKRFYLNFFPMKITRSILNEKNSFRWQFWTFSTKPEVEFSDLYFLLINTIKLENLPLKFWKYLN